jgi:hypothetical protein
VSDCQRFESMIEGFFASELPPQALSELLAHTKGCEACRRLLSIHGDLAAAGADVPEPDEADFELRQARVLFEIKRRRTRRPLRWVAVAAGVILPFVLGLLAGRFIPARSSSTGTTSRLMETLHAEAAGNRGLSDVEDSPFTYSNVAYRTLDGNRVELDFDVTTHLQSIESTHSPLVREVLTQSLLNPSSVGERLKAVSFAASAPEPKLKQAVLFALRHDDNVAVRLAALTLLVNRLDDEEVQFALMTALRDDPSVQVRLAALESLSSHRVDHRRIREALGVHPAPGNEPLMVRLAEIERNP